VAEVQQLRGIDTFAAAARQVSAAPSAERGGRIDWLSLNEVPPQLRTELLTLPVGGITQPLRAEGAVAIFQLRALEETPLERPETVAVEYALFQMPGAVPADAIAVTERVDTCDDFYGEAHGLPEDRLLRETQAPSEIPADVVGAIATLDENETATFARGNTQVVLMLCGRTTQEAEALDRGAVRTRLGNLRTATFADAFLSELRADAEIIDLR
ncbi:MAG: peptidylprolyl isomerase, partial [Pseudomonadota bacterium]